MRRIWIRAIVEQGIALTKWQTLVNATIEEHGYVLINLINSVASHQSQDDHGQHDELVKLLDRWRDFARGTL